MEAEKGIILNRIQTPDGTILTSYHRHDYKSYTDKNGKEYMVDGGTDYLRRIINEEAPHKELSVYANEPFEKIRKFYHRGGTITGELIWTPMYKMSNNWLKNCILYNIERGSEKDCVPNKMYQKELDYRKDNNILLVDWIRAFDESPEYDKPLLYWFEHTGFGMGSCEASEEIDGIVMDCFVGGGGFL